MKESFIIVGDGSSLSRTCKECGGSPDYGELFDSFVSGNLERPLKRCEARGLYDLAIMRIQNVTDAGTTGTDSDDDFERASLTLAQVHELRRIIYFVDDTYRAGCGNRKGDIYTKLCDHRSRPRGGRGHRPASDLDEDFLCEQG